MKLGTTAKKQIKEVRWPKGIELVKLARRDRQSFDCAIWLHKARLMLKADFKKEVERGLTGGDGSVGDCLLQTVPEPYVGHRESKSKPRRGCWEAIAPEATVLKWPARTFWPEPTWTAGIQRRCFSR